MVDLIKKNVLIQLREKSDKDIIKKIKEDGGNVSAVIRRLLRDYRDRGFVYDKKEKPAI